MPIALATVLSGAITYNHTKAVKYQDATNNQIKQLQQEVQTNQVKQIDSLKKQTQDQQQQIENLKTQVQARAQEKARLASLQSAGRALASFAVQNAYAGSGDAKSFIYMHESGNRPGAINPSSGACGLGQALPCSKMPCSLSDYACQDNWFTQYMLSRYGSWENAKGFWLAHSWW